MSLHKFCLPLSRNKSPDCLRIAEPFWSCAPTLILYITGYVSLALILEAGGKLLAEHCPKNKNNPPFVLGEIIFDGQVLVSKNLKKVFSFSHQEIFNDVEAHTAG